MNKASINVFLVKIKKTTNEIELLNQKLRQKLGLLRMKPSNKKDIEHTNKSLSEIRVVEAIHLNGELDVFSELYHIGEEFRDTIYRDAGDELNDELTGYKENATQKSNHHELEEQKTPSDLLREQSKITCKKSSQEEQPIYDAFYLFYDRVDDLIVLLEHYFKYGKKKEKESLNLMNDIELAYRKIDEMFSRITLINSGEIRTLSNKQKRQLDSIINLIHSLY